MSDDSRGVVVWFTGYPASGKSTLAGEVAEALARRGVDPVILDSDEFRKSPAAAGLDYTDAGRDEFYRRLSASAAGLGRAGRVVLVAATAPRRKHRGLPDVGLRSVLVHVATPLDVCRNRDPKGLYARAQAGLVSNLPGIDALYEAPERPDVVAKDGSDEAVAAVVDAVLARDR